ncbi:hypothetical protein CBS101457_001678 [Exobasidium rhododendri]|nr:hypothetical protein CBS101457_001678 [Exobasidium rhododendri]
MLADQEADELSSEVETPPKQGTLLLVFIHGFKGSEKTTFGDFPSRLAHILSQTLTSLEVQPVIYPTYDTRGSLSKAVEAFVDWLTTTCVDIECKPVEEGDEALSGRGKGAGSVKVVLCGHSMGGLVAVDAALEIAKSGGVQKGKLWPRVCGVIACDTPYYGVNPNVFKNTANKYHGYYQTAMSIGTHLAPVGTAIASYWASTSTSNSKDTKRIEGGASGDKKKSSSWTSALLATGAVALAGGAAAGTYMGGGWDYLSDHFLFVSNLWDDKGMKKRLDDLIETPQIFFHALYNRLPPLPTNSLRASHPRTFIILPPQASAALDSFEAIDNKSAPDEIDAHTTMFYTSSSSYYHLGLRSAALITTCLENEEQYGDQVHTQSNGNREHGQSSEDAYGVKEEEDVKPAERPPSYKQEET